MMMNRLFFLACFLAVVTSSQRREGVTTVFCYGTWAICVSVCRGFNEGRASCLEGCRNAKTKCLTMARKNKRTSYV
ncbi:hypothetical protein ScPMuIL_001766 [Solemya velum]